METALERQADLAKSNAILLDQIITDREPRGRRNVFYHELYFSECQRWLALQEAIHGPDRHNRS